MFLWYPWYMMHILSFSPNFAPNRSNFLCTFYYEFRIKIFRTLKFADLQILIWKNDKSMVQNKMYFVIENWPANGAPPPKKKKKLKWIIFLN